MEEDENMLAAIVVTPSPFRKTVESPVSMRIIGLQEIEKKVRVETGIFRELCGHIQVYRSHLSDTETI